MLDANLGKIWQMRNASTVMEFLFVILNRLIELLSTFKQLGLRLIYLLGQFKIF